MTTSTASNWATIKDVHFSLDVITEANDELDEFAIILRGKYDAGDPYTKLPEGVPMPTAADVAALAVFCDHAREDLDAMTRLLDDIARARDVAIFWYSQTQRGGGDDV